MPVPGIHSLRRFSCPLLLSNEPIKIFITMACYEADLYGQMNQQNHVSDWDMSEYEEIQDFQCTTNYGLSKIGRTWI